MVELLYLPGTPRMAAVTLCRRLNMVYGLACGFLSVVTTLAGPCFDLCMIETCIGPPHRRVAGVALSVRFYM